MDRVQQQSLQDPRRAHYLSCFSTALRHCLKLLRLGDRERLELLLRPADEAGGDWPQLGEHESSVSRNLERIRQELRALAEQHLRDAFSLSHAEIQQCFEYCRGRCAHRFPAVVSRCDARRFARKPEGTNVNGCKNYFRRRSKEGERHAV